MRKAARLPSFLFLTAFLGTILPGADSPKSRVNISYEQAQPILTVIGDQLPSELKGRSPAEMAAIWPSWVTRHDQETRARLMRGDLDTLVNFLVLGTSFTLQRGLTGTEFEQLHVSPEAPRALSDGSPASTIFFRRVYDLLRGLAHPENNERLLFLAHLVESQGYHPRKTYGAHPNLAERARLKAFVLGNVVRVTKEQEGFQKTYQEALGPDGHTEDLAVVSTLYRTRGLSLDTSLLPNLALEESLKTMQTRNLLAPRSVRRVAVIGPGLDFADKAGGYDFYPQQTIQPYALIDTLFRLGLARRGELQVTTLDISLRVNDHLRRTRRRAVPGQPYVVQLPRNPQVLWYTATSLYWRQFGDHIGRPVAPNKPPEAVGSVETRAVQISPDIVSLITPVDLDIETEHLTLPPQEGFDLIVATNVFCYFGPFEQLLAVANTQSMLRPGEFLLSNDLLPMLPSGRMSSAGSLPVSYSDRPNDGDVIVWYQWSPN